MNGRLALALCFCLYAAAALTAQVTFSEVMFDVVGSDAHDEFIELYNLSATESIDLSGWKLSDSLAQDELTDAGMGLLLQPGRFAVILDGSYWTNSDTYQDIIPAEALVITIDDAALGSGGLTNTKGKRLSLLDANGNEVTAYRYSPDNQPGYSDEKILLPGDNNPQNWANSTVLGGTPGYRNSVSPYDYDLGFTEGALVYHPALMRRLRTVQVEGFLRNTGLRAFNQPFQLLLYIDDDQNGRHDGGEEILLEREETAHLAPNDTIVFTAQWTPQNAGVFLLTAQITAANDENRSNNKITVEIPVVESLETVCINEIKFLTFEGEPEWIELLNTGDQPLTLKDWGIADSRDTCWIDTLLHLYPTRL